MSGNASDFRGTVKLPPLTLAAQEVDPADVRFLWHLAYWDGPLSGICQYRDRPHYFCTADQEEATIDQRPRPYFLVELRVDQVEELRRQHEVFRRYVGTHTDYLTDGSPSSGIVRRRNLWSRFYDQSKTWAAIDLSDNRVVGKFAMSPIVPRGTRGSPPGRSID
jgi:hypothetical protein